MPPTEKQKNTRAWPVLVDYARATRKYPWLFALTFSSVLAIVGTSVAAPLYLKRFIDLIATQSVTTADMSVLLVTLTIYSAITTLQWALYRAQLMGITRIEAKVEVDLINSAFAYMIHHGHEFFINSFAGTLTRRVSRYAKSYEQVFNSIFMNMLPTFLFAVGVIVVLYIRNHILGIGLLTWTIFFLVLQFFMTNWRYHYKLQRAAQDSRLTGALSDAVGNHSAITYFATEAYEQKRLGAVVTDWYQATLRAWNSDSINYAVQGFLTRSAQIALLFGGLYLWHEGRITVGDFVLIQVYIISLMDAIGNIGSNMRQLYDAFAEANEMIDIMQLPHAIADVSSASALKVSKGEVSFVSVNFSFDNSRSILADFNLTVIGGEKIALIGPSGAGKSTLTKLLMRLYDVTDGSLRIDDMDIRDVSQESLRSAISFVPQESILFHRTLRENIAYGKVDASDEEIISAAKKAHCHEFISKLPLGYDTFVGERGVKLSGGERQRVAIARAILKNAPILVLDEATSSLDSESEHYIQEALDVLMQGKTVIVIAHRLSTIMKMDRIVVMEQGAIVAEGTHSELLEQDGLYKKLWSIQAGGFLGGETEPKETGEAPETEEEA